MNIPLRVAAALGAVTALALTGLVPAAASPLTPARAFAASDYERDLTGDGAPDVMVYRTDLPNFGTWIWSNNGSGRFASAAKVTTVGYEAMVIRVGDWNEDGAEDFMGLSSGSLELYMGDGGGSTSGSWDVVHDDWTGRSFFVGPGDFDGDGHPDLISRTPGGTLWLDSGDADHGFVSGAAISSGWTGVTAIVTPGDFDSDGFVDIIVRDKVGGLWLYPGDGAGGLLPRVKVSAGWQNATAIFSVGDFSMDGPADIMARDRTGAVWLYPGDGSGHLGARVKIGSGWNSVRIAP